MSSEKPLFIVLFPCSLLVGKRLFVLFFLPYSDPSPPLYLLRRFLQAFWGEKSGAVEYMGCFGPKNCFLIPYISD